MQDFENLTTSFRETIFTWDYYCNFDKIIKNSFNIKVQLNILNSLIGETKIEKKFIEIITQYPETREVLPILLAVREKFKIIFDEELNEIHNVSYLFDKEAYIVEDGEEKLLNFFNKSGLRKIFENKNISNLNDYVFGIETGLDSNARKNRSGSLMENLVLEYIEEFCNKGDFEYKDQATAKWVKENWGINIESDKSNRRFDFAILNKKSNKVYLIEVNFYGGGGSKLKAVAGEFSNLYRFLKKQDISLIWVTDGGGWKTTLKALEEAYSSTEGNIYNLNMLDTGILSKLIK